MSVNAIIEFDDLLQHSFDSTKIEISGGQAKLKSQVDANEILFSNFDTDDDLISKRGAKTLTLGGNDNTGEVVGGILNFPNQDASDGRYLNITDIVNDFSFRLKVNMHIISLVTTRDIVVLKSNIDSSKIRLYLQKQTDSITRILVNVTDSSGVQILNLIIATRDFSIDPIFEIGFSNDDDGNMLSYINGALINTTASPALNFTDCDFVLSDALEALYDFDNVQLWSAVIDLAVGSISPEDTTFLLDAQEIITAAPFIMDSWTSFSDNKTVLDGSQVRHQPLRDSVRYFFNTVSALWEKINLGLDKFSQSNLDTIINANLPAFPLTIGIGTTIQIASFLKASLDGYTTPILDTITLKYGRQHKAGAIGICTVIGVVKDKSGLPVVGAEVEFSSKIKKSFLLNNVLIGPTVIAITDSEGKWSLSLVETASSQNTVTATIDFKDGSDPRVFKNLTIPDLPSKEFEDIVLGI